MFCINKYIEINKRIKLYKFRAMIKEYSEKQYLDLYQAIQET